MSASPKSREKALGLLGRGFTRAEVAKKVRVSERTVYRWEREAERASAAAMATKPETPAPAPTAALSEVDPHAAPTELTRKILHESLQGAELAKSDGNLTAAQRFLKHAHSAAHDLQRAERENKAHADTVTFTRAELDAKRKAMVERVTALAADLERTGGLVCSTCGRNLRIAIARGDT